MTDQPAPPPKPTELQVKTLLDQLANAQAKLTVLHMEVQELSNSVIPKEVMEKLGSINEEYAPKFFAANEAIADLEDKAKQAVVDYGESVKGTFLVGVFNPGKVTWKNKELDGYAVAHPEIKAFRNVGKAYTTIKPTGK